MGSAIEGPKPGEKLANHAELSDLLNSAVDFAKSGEQSTEGGSHAMIRSFYSINEGQIYTVILFSNGGELDSVTVCEMLPCHHHSTAGKQVIMHQFRQINMTFNPHDETWQFAINELGELNSKVISQAVARKMTQLLQSETRPMVTQSLSLTSPK